MTHLSIFGLGVILLSSSAQANAEEYYWHYWNIPDRHFGTALEACNQFQDPILKIELIMQTPAGARCRITRLSDGYVSLGIGVDRRGEGCPDGKFSNDTTGSCSNDQQKGAPLAESCQGNPINIAIGNKFERQIDYTSSSYKPLVFFRSYNSADGLWQHGFSSRIRSVVGRLSLVHSDGRESFYTTDAGKITPDLGETGILSATANGWIYTGTDNSQATYDAAGKLISLADPEGFTQRLSYTSNTIVVSDDAGRSLTVTEDSQHQPLSLSASKTSVQYSYDTNNHLIALSKTQDSHTESQKFLYEDQRNSNLLTGLIDARGIRFATWSYDDLGRAISSQHSNGSGLTQVTYNGDGSRTVTNELGKTATYKYQQIGGIKRVAAIIGEPSANCSASDSSYSYNEKGQLAASTDAKGYVTTYTYNDRGLETSRIEASGTSQARTTTTEWDPSRFLRTKVVEPTRTTVYTYDAQGRPLSQQVSAR